MRIKILLAMAAILISSAAFADDAPPITLSGAEAQSLYDILTKPALEQVQADGSRTPLVIFDPRQLAAVIKEKMATAQIQKNMPPAASPPATPSAAPAASPAAP